MRANLQVPRSSYLYVTVSLAYLVLVVGILYWARAVLIPIALAILLTFILAPIVIISTSTCDRSRVQLASSRQPAAEQCTQSERDEDRLVRVSAHRLVSQLDVVHRLVVKLHVALFAAFERGG